ncbi:putative sugar ABC transporter ATP-binding protein [Yersinia frederiksenii]|uniref:Sn-glycerol-3-phosphate ABC transporter ATP-binding protein UgpC n=1 Tax=Yersinia alsatica TaxID=2890317 RepID=A0ABY5UQI1_9GAMM|nr:sn-glycerol-3-phosphate ABC transporter ATP-binding protein UgpC [Yersinia alsatica]OWF67356.1 ABC transporter ATP-binding protein [Yersinia frederiksenii]OWF79606.1 ABC transporter ATP-binding protein [Yersinia frederiksenii]UWM45726.1 sn-glycerol-3-phosphate ABC transporter ATP-binding protein UgpC [Yersinia alsatica]CFQ59928.1 putative sugar ABC transporter ATP-binding protein [Yersinia frederiksenii]CNC48976.1 putative sugar ABC transporter ATP-binding protein [Yersinia frederiksenii]
MGSVVLKNVCKSYGDTHVIRDVSLEIPDGEFCVLVGPSGCGKSTLLRMIAGLEEISGGTVGINDKDVTDVEPKMRDIAMVFQSYALYPQMTVRENMGFALKMAKMSKADISKKVETTAELLGLQALLERLPKDLSGGQRQRVAMGRAIVRNPQVFLFDEPLSNLDAKLRTQVRGEIRELHQRLKTTSVYVTHDQIEAMTMGQMIVVLREGRIEQVGTPLDLYDRPANLFVAGFIGSPEINQLKGTVVQQGAEFLLRLEDGSLLTLPVGLQVTEGQNVVYAIRPEQVNVVDETHSASALKATITAIENTGSDMQLFCSTGGGRFTSVFKQRLAVNAGETVYLQPKLAGIHIFDADTGVRVACQAA